MIYVLKDCFGYYVEMDCSNALSFFPVYNMPLKNVFKIFYLSLVLRKLIILCLGILFLLVSCASWSLLNFNGVWIILVKKTDHIYKEWERDEGQVLGPSNI